MYEEDRQEHQQRAETYNLLFIVLAVCAIGLFFLGISTATMALVYLCFLTLGVGFVFMRKREKHYLIVRDLEHKQRMQALDEKLDTYESVKATAYEAYQKVCNILEKPVQTHRIDTFLSDSLQEITELQAEGDFWKTLTRQCECWTEGNAETYVGALCIIETIECFDEKVARLPNSFKTDKDSCRNVWRKYIPFSNILFFTVIGDVSLTSTVTGGDATYHGVSINGVGIGEWKVDPIQIQHKEHDNRMIALVYKDHGEECSLFFPIDILPKIQALIPQFSQSSYLVKNALRSKTIR